MINVAEHKGDDHCEGLVKYELLVHTLGNSDASGFTAFTFWSNPIFREDVTYMAISCSIVDKPY